MLSKSKVLRTVEYLHLNGRITGKAIEYLMRSTELKSLKILDLDGYTSGANEHEDGHWTDMSRALDNRAVRAIAESPLSKQLRVIRLGSVPYGKLIHWEPLIHAARKMRCLERLDVPSFESPNDGLKGAFGKKLNSKFTFWNWDVDELSGSAFNNRTDFWELRYEV